MGVLGHLPYGITPQRLHGGGKKRLDTRLVCVVLPAFLVLLEMVSFRDCDSGKVLYYSLLQEYGANPRKHVDT